MHSPPKTVRAIIMICLAALCFTLNDTVTKFLIVHYDVTVIIFVRSILAMPMLAVMAIFIGKERVRWSSRILFHALRGAVGLLAAYLYIRGLEFISVAEAAVVVFASPCMITAGSVLFFRETVDGKKWAAVLVSFVGVVIAMQPGAGAFQPASLFILGAAFLYAVTALTARWIPPQDNLWTVSFFGAAFSALFVGPLAFNRWTAVDPADLLLFGCAALFSSLGIGLGALAYRSAAASDLAPFSYSGLIWSIGATWLVWGSVPGPWTFLGAFLIAASSVFHFVRSRNGARGQ